MSRVNRMCRQEAEGVGETTSASGSYDPSCIFGRTNDPRIWDYIGAINMFYHGMLALENELNAQIEDISDGGQSGEDFKSDTYNALKGYRAFKKRIRTGITVERRQQGA